MASRMLLVLALGFLVAAGPPKDAAVKEEMKKLEGTWAVESATFNGKALGKTVDEFVFAGGKLTMKGAGKEVEKLTIKIDPTQKPKTLDLGHAQPKVNAALGNSIYELDGDMLKICIGPPDMRPKELNDKEQILFTLKRKSS